VYSKYISGSSAFPPISPQKLSETPFEKPQELPKTLWSRQFLFSTLVVERSSTGTRFAFKYRHQFENFQKFLKFQNSKINNKKLKFKILNKFQNDKFSQKVKQKISKF
jgi:hypothetical protein